MRGVRESINLTCPLPQRQGRVVVWVCPEELFLFRNAVVTFSAQTLFLAKNHDRTLSPFSERLFHSREYNLTTPPTMVFSMRRVTGVSSRFVRVSRQTVLVGVGYNTWSIHNVRCVLSLPTRSI